MFALGTPVADMLILGNSRLAAIVRIDEIDLPSGTLVVPVVLRKQAGVTPYDLFVVKIVSQDVDEFVISFKKLE